MKIPKKPILTLNKKIGSVVIQFEDASTHIFIPEDHEFLEIDQGEFKQFLDDIQALLGDIKNKEHQSKTKISSAGEYTVDSTLYTSESYILNHVQDELYFGASAGTEQILIEILKESVASIASKKLIKRLRKLIYGGGDFLDWSYNTDQLYDNVKNTLLNYYGAAGEITFLETKEMEDEINMTAKDLYGKVFAITINRNSKIPTITIKNDK